MSLSLKDVIDAKMESPSQCCEIVDAPTRWLCKSLEAIQEDYQQFDCRAGFYAYSRITLQRNLHGIQTALEIKISELGGQAIFFADVRLIGQYYRPMLPVSGGLVTEDDHEKLLHYIADFILGVRSGEIEKNPRFSENLSVEYPAPSGT